MKKITRHKIELLLLQVVKAFAQAILDAGKIALGILIASLVFYLLKGGAA